jgi:hypothetical protein
VEALIHCNRQRAKNGEIIGREVVELEEIGEQQEATRQRQLATLKQNAVRTVQEAQVIVPASGLRGVAAAYLSDEAQFRASLTSTPMSGRYAAARVALLAGFDAMHRVCQSAVASGGQTYDASAYQEAGADLQAARVYVS